MSPRWRTVRIL